MTWASRRSAAMLPTQRALLQGLAVARWASWVWLATTTLIERADLRHRAFAAVFVMAALVWTTGCTVALRRRPAALTHPAAIAGEVALACGLLVADGWVFQTSHTFSKGQNLAGSWPLIAVLSGAVTLGPVWGAVSAMFVGTGRFFGALANGVSTWPSDRVLSLLTTLVFYAVGASLWGGVARRLHAVESEVALRRAREEVARTLHDGVLQTLALVERRTSHSDPELAAVARNSDRELRAWLFHETGAATGDVGERVDLERSLRGVASRVSQAYDLAISVSVIGDGDGDPGSNLAPGLAHAIVAAVGEALTNAAKHAGARRVVVFGEASEGSLFVSVRDDGCGFDPDSPTDRRGVEHSIRRRMADAGGRVEIVSAPGAGTEVRIWSE